MGLAHPQLHALVEELDHQDRVDHAAVDAVTCPTTRIHPAIVVQAAATAAIQLPGRRLVPLIPRAPRLRFQAVHSSGVGEAYRQAVVRDVHGAFNITAEPEIGVEALCEFFGARSFPLPAGALRGAASLSWKLRLQPSSPGWIDLALGAPMMDNVAGARGARLGAGRLLARRAGRPAAGDAPCRGRADAAARPGRRRPAAGARARDRGRREATGGGADPPNCIKFPSPGWGI